MRSDTEPWWEQAEADLRVAVTLLAAGHFYAVSFFAQQAAEKAMKALFNERRAGSASPRTHDLIYLGGQMAVPADVQGALAALYPAFGLSRYPIGGIAPVNRIGERDARAYLAAALQVLSWTESQL